MRSHLVIRACDPDVRRVPDYCQSAYIGQTNWYKIPNFREVYVENFYLIYHIYVYSGRFWLSSLLLSLFHVPSSTVFSLIKLKNPYLSYCFLPTERSNSGILLLNPSLHLLKCLSYDITLMFIFLGVL